MTLFQFKSVYYVMKRFQTFFNAYYSGTYVKNAASSTGRRTVIAENLRAQAKSRSPLTTYVAFDPSINSAATYAIDCLACHKYGAGVTIALYVKHANREIHENWKIGKTDGKMSKKVVLRASIEIRLNCELENIIERKIIAILSRDNLNQQKEYIVC